MKERKKSLITLFFISLIRFTLISRISISIRDSILSMIRPFGFSPSFFFCKSMHIAYRLLRIFNEYYCILFYLFVYFIMCIPNGIARKSELDIEFRFYLWLLAYSTKMAILYVSAQAHVCIIYISCINFSLFSSPINRLFLLTFLRSTTHRMNVFFRDIWSTFVCYQKKIHSTNSTHKIHTDPSIYGKY